MDRGTEVAAVVRLGRDVGRLGGLCIVAVDEVHGGALIEPFEDRVLEKMEKMMLEQAGPMLEQMPPEQVEKMKEQMLEGMKDSRVDMEVKADGTFEVKAKMQGDTDVITGTWTQEGDVVTFVEKEENGEPKEDGETIKATIQDGNLLLKPDQEMPFDLIMKKN